MKKSLIGLLFLTLLNSKFTFGQETILANFFLEVNANKILLDWTVKAGNTCNGIDIYRSNGTDDFKEIGHISGVCGNLGYSTNYTFTDENPLKNQINYYRLNLGGIQISETKQIEYIEIDESKYVLKHQENGQNATLYFENNNNKSLTIQIYTLNGSFFNKFETNSNYLEINYAEFPKGIIYFKIENSKEDVFIVGKIPVL